MPSEPLLKTAYAPRVVLAHGVFDLLHLGHIRHLQEARALGDKLVVGITSDRYVNKGMGRPQFSTEQRREALLALSCVDDVIVSDAETATEIISAVRPTFYVKGRDYADGTPGLQKEIAALDAVGGKFYITTSEKWSSSQLLRTVRLPDSTLAYLQTARERGFLEQILAAFERADKLKLAFVGETIIDEYRYVGALGKPSKEVIMATVFEREESFHGGIAAGAAHGDWKNVTVVCGGHPIIKTRFIDADFTRKLFEVYSERCISLQPVVREKFNDKLETAVAESDAVIVMDFGHGLMDRAARQAVLPAKFLAVNAQTNAANAGFNPVTLYQRADLVCVDEPEARFALGDQYGPVAEMIYQLHGRMNIITCGRRGSLLPHASIPAFADHGIDTMGAGDAFLAIAAPLVAAGLDLEMAAFAGNVAGGLKTAIIGHRDHVHRSDIVQNIEWLLK